MEQPLYLQLSEQIIEKIKNEMEVGDLLLSERKLAETYNVSRTTVRLALDDLETKGYISRKHGKGSFVVDYHKNLINLGEMYSFTEQMKAIGKTPTTKLISYSIIDATDFLNKIFANGENRFIELIRLRLSDEVPMLYEKSYIPYSKFKQISAEEISRRSLYDIFREDYGEVVKLAQEEFSAGLASEEEARHLEIENHSAVLKFYRTTINMKNEVIEYTESKARPDKFTYRTVHYNHLVL